jgi:hypothetical protein
MQPELQTARAQLGSEISTIRDVLPDLGTGFVAACLQQMNHKVEVCVHIGPLLFIPQFRHVQLARWLVLMCSPGD